MPVCDIPGKFSENAAYRSEKQQLLLSKYFVSRLPFFQMSYTRHFLYKMFLKHLPIALLYLLSEREYLCQISLLSFSLTALTAAETEAGKMPSQVAAESSDRMHSVFLFLSLGIAIYTQHMLRFRPVPYISANPTYFFSFAPLFSLYSSFSSKILRSSSASVLVSDFLLVNASRKFFRDPWYSFSTRFSVHCPISSSSVIAG